METRGLGVGGRRPVPGGARRWRPPSPDSGNVSAPEAGTFLRVRSASAGSSR